jgi:uncharacterized repeat protein (TIGR03803 family)
LYSFNNNGTDGYWPDAGLIFDPAGNLYGTTTAGGTGCGDSCAGTVFQLTPGKDGKWTETLLHSFNFNGKDGFYPTVGLILDGAGNLYGTTVYGGASGTGCGGLGCGTVFELTPGANGKWTEKLLHSFGNGKDGSWPDGRLIFDEAGNLYGIAANGGPSGKSCGGYGCGIAFELTPGTNGRWTESLLHSFNGKDGQDPHTGLMFDTAGNLYGTTMTGGASGTGCGGYGCGTVFQLAPGTNGKWAEKVLHSFGKGKDGIWPWGEGPLIFDVAGNLYGTTSAGGDGSCSSGSSYGCGTVFELTPGANGKWTEKLLHNFDNNRTDGLYPDNGLLLDTTGNLYGNTGLGGTYAYGTVFEITP